MKILFVVRRFHTNLYFAVKALLAKGHDLELLCSTEEKAEDHRHLRPTIVDPSALGWKRARDYVKRIAPDVVVVRHTRGKLRYVSYAAAMLGIRAIGYDLRPYHLRRGFIARANDFVRGKPVWRMTPVLGDSRAAPPDPHAFYIPLPVDRVRRGPGSTEASSASSAWPSSARRGSSTSCCCERWSG